MVAPINFITWCAPEEFLLVSCFSLTSHHLIVQQELLFPYEVQHHSCICVFNLCSFFSSPSTEIPRKRKLAAKDVKRQPKRAKKQRSSERSLTSGNTIPVGTEEEENYKREKDADEDEISDKVFSDKEESEDEK